MKDFKELLEQLKNAKKQTLVLAGAEDIEALKAVKEASDMGIINTILVGNQEIIKKNCESIDFSEYEIINSNSEIETAEKSVKLISGGKGTVLMKGMIKTAKLLKATLNKDWGLRTGRLLSHVAVASTPVLSKLVAITDGGMNLTPTLEEKVDIINNAVELMKTLGVETPKVAPIAAVEVVNPKMSPTVDAAILSKMNSRGQIKGCIVDGPLGLDNALSAFAAKIKNVSGEVAGNADILVVPDIHSGNFLGKSVEYIGGGTIGGLIMGAAAPIVIVSRADKAEAKLASIALGVMNSLNHK